MFTNDSNGALTPALGNTEQAATPLSSAPPTRPIATDQAAPRSQSLSASTPPATGSGTLVTARRRVGAWRPRRRVLAPLVSIATGVILMAVVVSGLGLRILSAAGWAASSRTPVDAYHDSLLDRPAGWTTSPQCRFQRDGYHVAGQNVCLMPLGMTPNDSIIEVTVRPWVVNAQTGFGVVLRHADTNSFYAFEITATGQWGIIFIHDGHGSLLAGFTSATQIKQGLGSTNTLRVVAVGARFTFSVNGMQVATIHDTRLASGDSGVFTDDNNASSEVVFTDFAMTRVA